MEIMLPAEEYCDPDYAAPGSLNNWWKYPRGRLPSRSTTTMERTMGRILDQPATEAILSWRTEPITSSPLRRTSARM